MYDEPPLQTQFKELLTVLATDHCQHRKQSVRKGRPLCFQGQLNLTDMPSNLCNSLCLKAIILECGVKKDSLSKNIQCQV